MEKTYDTTKIETLWYRAWERSGYFAPGDEGPSYCIMIPPPNVTGSLHMGHAFQDTIMDALTRFKRMDGRSALWQPGSDHAGIATQMVVERQLQSQGLDRKALGREAFVERVWEWKERSGGTISRQLRRLGASLDWEHERFTMDPGLSAAVLETFVRLYEKGLIYRGKRLVNWDPVLLTAISDLEVASEEEDGFLWHIRYPVAGEKNGHVTVATTRPETLLGDTAVAVHPDDERYRHLRGKQLELPLTGRLIPVISDEHVDPEFGSGCVKITPAHDFNDYAVGQRHGLSLINIFTPDAHINDNAPGPYRGLDRFEARERVLADLAQRGLLERREKHKLMVPRGDRSHSVIEPYLTDQWFVRTEPLARPAIEAVESGRVRFVPESWAKTYYEWMHNIEDWCISRQLWWGHRIPAWYDREGNTYVGRSEAQVREKHGLEASVPLTQDEDVLDTWFSSQLWPFSTLGWPAHTDRLDRFYPTSVLVTGFDIIFFWVARMIMMGLEFMGDVPFREVYIHGLVRDADGAKMSKSKGNILDPLDLIDGIGLDALLEKRTTGLMQPELAPRIHEATIRQFPNGIPAFGTDALRFTFCSLATTGRDIRFDLGRIEGYRNFCNKLWNAARFVVMNTEDGGRSGDAGLDHGAAAGPGAEPRVEPEAQSAVSLGVADRWIRSRLNATVAAVREAFDAYRFDRAAHAIYEFTWNQYCDWYLELVKATLADGAVDSAARLGARRTLLDVLETLLRLAHPLMPFITEEIWQRVAPAIGRGGKTIMLAPFPVYRKGWEDADAESEIAWVQGLVLGIRQIRGEMNISPSKRLRVLLQGPPAIPGTLERCGASILSLGRLESIEWVNGDEAPRHSALALHGEVKILVPLEGLIDVAGETARLRRELEKQSTDLDRCRAKLANEKFVSRAPAPVVAKERARLESITSAIVQLEGQLARLEQP